MVLDLVGNRSLRDLNRVLKPGGMLVLSGEGVSGTGRCVGPLGMLVRAQSVARLTGLPVAVPQAKPTADGLAELAALVTSDAIRPVVDRTFAFGDAAQAIRCLETEHARAKVVISLG